MNIYEKIQIKNICYYIHRQLKNIIKEMCYSISIKNLGEFNNSIVTYLQGLKQNNVLIDYRVDEPIVYNITWKSMYKNIFKRIYYMFLHITHIKRNSELNSKNAILNIYIKPISSIKYINYEVELNGNV